MRCLSMLALLVTAPAHAVDLDLVIEAWTATTAGAGGEDGQDSAEDVAIDGLGNIIAVGHIDGMSGHEDNGLVIRYLPDGTVDLQFAVDQGPIAPPKFTSQDQLFGVTATAADGFAISGTLSEDDNTGGIAQSYYLAMYDSYGVMTWDDTFIDGLDSSTQVAEAITTMPSDDLFVGGWTTRVADAGRWAAFTYDDLLGFPGLPMRDNFSTLQFEPDRILDVGVDTLSALYMVGIVGVSGSPGSPTNNSDGYIRKVDSYGVLLWEEAFAGVSLLEDAFTGIVVDSNEDVIAVGYENNGSNNVAGADDDWLIVKYAEGGNLFAGDRLWTVRWESASGASERATSVAIDDNDDVLVAGYAIDAASGLQVWKVVKFANIDGQVLQEWTGPVHSGDAWINGIAVQGEGFAMAGVIPSGTDADDFAVGFREPDTDADGFSDSVDFCENDPEKWLDGGFCGCDISDADTDSDGFLDCDEECDADPLKQDPGLCGCDRDDGDRDGDGVEDCNDNCPDDPDKVNFGVCGCGAPDTDSDGDGVLGCNDVCANTPPGVEVDEFGCEPGVIDPPTDDAADGTGTTDDDGGCGCASTPTPAGALALLPAVSILLRRRR